MGKVYVMNARELPGVFAAATEATEFANEAAQKALEAAGSIDPDALVYVLLPMIREELGSTPTPPGEGEEEEPGEGEDLDPNIWDDEVSYLPGDEVVYPLGDGRTGYFELIHTAPVGTPPTDSTFWRMNRATESTYALSFDLSAMTLDVTPGDSASLELTLRRTGGLPDDHLLKLDAITNEPGLTPEFVRLDDVTSSNDETVERYTLTIRATADIPEGRFSLVITAKSAEWADDPDHPYYRVFDTEPLQVVASVAAVSLAPNAVAVYGMDSATFTLEDFLRDAGPNNLTLLKKGSVRLNSRGDGVRVEKDPGSVLYTPPLTGRTLATGAEVSANIVYPDRIEQGAVLMALASTTRKHDYVMAYGTAQGWRIRTALQNAAGTGAIFADSATALPITSTSTRPVLMTAGGKVYLFEIRSGLSVVMDAPAWPAGGGVRASWYGINLADETVIQSSAGDVLAATVHPDGVSTIRRDRNAQYLAETFTKRTSADAKPEFDNGARFISLMLKGEETKDRTFYHAGWIKIGTAGFGADGGLTAPGDSTSGWWTGWLPDVVLEKDFTLTVEVKDFLKNGLGQVALTSESNSTVWGRIRPEGTSAIFDWLDGAVKSTMTNLGDRPSHLFRFEYNALTRKLTPSELYSGAVGTAVDVPAGATGMLALCGGLVYLGKGSTGTYGGVTRVSKAHLLKAYISNKRLSKAELTADLELLGTQSVNLEPSGGPGVPVTPPVTPPVNPDPGDLDDFTDPRRNDNFSTAGWPQILKDWYARCKIEWQYAKNQPVSSRRTNFSGSPAWRLTVNQNRDGLARTGSDTITAAATLYRLTKDPYWLYEMRDFSKRTRENYRRTFTFYNIEQRKDVEYKAYYVKDGREYRIFTTEFSQAITRADPWHNATYRLYKEDFPALVPFVQIAWYLYNNSDLDPSFMTEVNYWNKWADETEQKYLATNDNPIPYTSVIHQLVHGPAEYSHFTAKMVEKLPSARTGPGRSSKHYAAYRANPAKWYRDLRDKMIVWFNNGVVAEKTSLSNYVGAYWRHIPPEIREDKVVQMIGYYVMSTIALTNMYLEGVPNIEERMLKMCNASMAYNVMNPGKVYDATQKKNRDYALYKQPTPRRSGRGTDSSGSTWTLPGLYNEKVFNETTRTFTDKGKPRSITIKECGLGNDNGVAGFDYNYEFSDGWLISKTSNPPLLLWPCEGSDPRQSKMAKRIAELYGSPSRSTTPYKGFAPAAWSFAALHRFRQAGGVL